MRDLTAKVHPRAGLQLMALLLLLIVLANSVLLLLDGLVELPVRLTVRSAGFSFPAMQESGQLVRNVALGGLLLAALAWQLLLPARTEPRRPRAWLRGLPAREVGLACAGIAFLWGMYAAYPPQISFTNFRMIWVDWALDDRKIRYFGQILRSALYDYPHLLQAAATLLSFLAFQGIARRSGHGVLAASLLALAFCTSAVFVQFAGAGEDWLVITAMSVATIWAYSGRRWGAMVLALVGLGGLRLPASFVVLIAVTLVEVARCALAVRERSRAPWVPVAWTVGRLVLAWAAVVAGSYLGFTHFSAYGEGILAAVTTNRNEMIPIAIDGFTLSRFSGTYAAHALWALPPVLLASSVVMLAFAKPLLRTAPGRTALVSSLAFGGTILLYEAVTGFQYYYNYRYLAMAVPFGLSALLWVLAKFQASPVVVFAAVLSVLVSHPWPDTGQGKVDERRHVEHTLYSCRNVLSPVLQGKTVYVTSKKKLLANSVAYVSGHAGGATPELLARGKRRFEAGEVVLLPRGRASRNLARRSDLEQVVECRGWVVLAPG